MSSDISLKVSEAEGKDVGKGLENPSVIGEEKAPTVSVFEPILPRARAPTKEQLIVVFSCALKTSFVLNADKLLLMTSHIIPPPSRTLPPSPLTPGLPCREREGTNVSPTKNRQIAETHSPP